MKRRFDIVAAALGIIVLSPLWLAVALLIKLTSPGPIFFRQERVGRHFLRFQIYKFRTMVHEADRRGRPITVGADPRVTSLGRFLRASKIDEFPQLLNVLKGEMSLVGPRPEVPLYVELYRQNYEEVLQMRPGITDLASIRYRHEAELLGASADPEIEYVMHLLPIKIRLGKEYARRSSFWLDLVILWRTFLVLFHIKASPRRISRRAMVRGTELRKCP